MEQKKSVASNRRMVSQRQLSAILNNTKTLQEVAPKLLEFALAHLIWELDLFHRDAAWTQSSPGLHLPIDLAERMVELQRLRNIALMPLIQGDKK